MSYNINYIYMFFLLIYACRLLKALVTKWLHDFETQNDYHALSLLNNCYRYLCGGSGNNTLLSDPALHRYFIILVIC